MAAQTPDDLLLRMDAKWYGRGWDDYDGHLPLGQGLWVMHESGESKRFRDQYKRGWRDALVCDLSNSVTAPEWMKKELNG